MTSSSQATSGTSYSFSYGYNAAGTLTSETYPSGRTVSMGVDGADRIAAVTGSGSGKAYVSNATYAPHGGVSSYRYNKLLMNKGYQYNARLQPIDMRDTQQGQSTFLLDLNLYWGDNGTQTTNNNGNLRGEGINTNNGPTLSTQINSGQPLSYDNVSGRAFCGRLTRRSAITSETS